MKPVSPAREKAQKSGTAKEMCPGDFQAALLAVDPYEAVVRHREEILRTYDLNKGNKVWLIGFGKAASGMAAAAADILQDKLSQGIIITKYGHARPGERRDGITVCEAGHPLPDTNGVRATQEVLRLLNRRTPGP